MRDVRVSAVFVCVVGSSLCATVLATENGGLSYPLGVNTIAAGVMPGPGQTWLQNYSAYYDADTFTDEHGHSSVPGFKARVFVNATRLFHNWDRKIGPFDLLSGLVVPLYRTTAGSSLGTETNYGVGDIEIQPLYLGYTNQDKSFYGFAGIDVYVPTRSNVSSNYYTFSPTVYMTWFPGPKWELSTAFGVEFHTRNNDSRYRSGNVFFADYGVNYKPSDKLPGLAIGLGGYLTSQFSDDQVSGQTILGGFRQKGFALGPQISYSGSFGAIGLKWQREFKTKNRPEGDKIWLQWMIPLNI